MNLKKILFLLILGLFCLPILQYTFNIIEVNPLAGVNPKFKERPKPTLKSWFSANFQDSTNLYFDEQIGFKPWLIKLTNQIDYSLLNHTTAPGVVIGKEDYLYIESYILGYIGQNYIGEEKISEKVNNLQEISDFLDKQGVSLIVTFAPGKASFLPEYIPNKYDPENPKTSNYNTYSKLLSESNIRFLDFNDYFKMQKKNFPYPVYSKVGTHWSSYAKSVVLDSIIHFIEKDRNIDMPDFEFNNINLSDSLEKVDWDIEEQMNLLWPLEHIKMPYPNYNFFSYGKNKPNTIVISDSYWWCMVADRLPNKIFNTDEYWFYFKDRHINNVKQKRDVANTNIKDELLKQNVILLMATEATLHMFPYGFDERFNKDIIVAEQYDQMPFNDKVTYWTNQIKKDPKWFTSIQAKAKAKGISTEEMLRLDSEFMARK